jgi:hypothetical protein
MIERVICLWHMESTPSLVLYEDHVYCYGCGKRASMQEYERIAGSIPGNVARSPRRQEDLGKTLDYIYTLPRKTIRGFSLPYDDRGFYIVYPNEAYYVKRLWGNDANKYRGPAGHKKPLFVPTNCTPNKPLFVVEGQLNAMSLAHSCDTVATMSPGACTDLSKYESVKYCLQYDSICIIVDKDPAGVVGGLELKKALLKHGKRIVLLPLEADLNDTYIQGGKDAVNQYVQKALSLL